MNLLIIVKHFVLYPWIVAKSYIVKFKAPSLQCSILLQSTNKYKASHSLLIVHKKTFFSHFANIPVLNIYLILFACKYTQDFHLIPLEK